MRHPINVRCYSGYRLDQKPREFTRQNRRFRIDKILEQSLIENISTGCTAYRFRVLCSDGRTYRLINESASHQWFLED
ncbi:MAG: hypothetical protein GY765_07425 [bacterium]|nr:hypothetical protein [bacterium]